MMNGNNYIFQNFFKYYEYFSKNSLGEMMGMFSKGWSANKSGSPVIIQFALADKASSRNISSFGSWHFETRCDTFINTVSATNRAKNLLRSPALKYLSNLCLLMTSFSSAYVKSEQTIVPKLRALSNTLSCKDILNRAALIRTLVSIIKFNYFSFRSCSSNSGVMPCFWAYSLMSSITCLSVLLSSIKMRIISLNPFLSSALSLSKPSARSSGASKVIVFIHQI